MGVSSSQTISHVTFASTKCFRVSQSGCHAPLVSVSLEREEAASLAAPLVHHSESWIYRKMPRMRRGQTLCWENTTNRQGPNPCIQILENGLVMWKVPHKIKCFLLQDHATPKCLHGFCFSRAVPFPLVFPIQALVLKALWMP